MFSGSYQLGDVDFLLKKLDMRPISNVIEKECAYRDPLTTKPTNIDHWANLG